MTGSVVAAGILELTFTFYFTERAGPLMIRIWRILCWRLLIHICKCDSAIVSALWIKEKRK